MFKLVIFRGDSVDNEVRLKGQTIRLGRDARNDIVLDDKTVTRFHAEMRAEGGSYFIEDLNSRNGVWVCGHRIETKTPLSLGDPVTIGAFELALEDDVSTSDLGEDTPIGNRTVVAAPAAAGRERAAGSAAAPVQSTNLVASAARRPSFFWVGIALVTLLLCAATYGIVRYYTGRATLAATTEPVVPPAAPAPPATTVAPNKDIVDGYVAAARTAINNHDYAAALRDDLEPLLNLDPKNQDALELKRQAEEGLAAPEPAKETPVAKPVPPPAAVVEVAGIPRRANETPAEYNSRAARVQSNYQEGSRNAEKQDFNAAIARFQAVERDQKGYQNVGELLSDTIAKQKQAVDEAVNNGMLNDRAGNLVNAVRWYEQALRIDPNSTAAQDKIASVAERRTKEGVAALDRAEVFRKRNENAKALAQYQRAVDLLPTTNDKRADALQWLEKLKP